MTQLQLAVDLVDTNTFLGMIHALKPYIDIFEMGTPFILQHGVTIVEKIHEMHPDITLLADVKICDGGVVETKMFCDCGAKYITVMARTNDATIANCIRTAHECGAEVVVDLMCVEDLKRRVLELEALGADVLAAHIAHDQYTQYEITPIKSIAELSGLVKTARTSVAGGIRLDTVKDYLQYDPAIIIVGGGILNAENPVDMARRFSEILHGEK